MAFNKPDFIKPHKSDDIRRIVAKQQSLMHMLQDAKIAGDVEKVMKLEKIIANISATLANNKVK